MSRVHHDDEGRIYLHDGRGQVWRMLVRGEPAAREAEFRSAAGATVYCPLGAEEGDGEIADARVVELFRRARPARNP